MPARAPSSAWPAPRDRKVDRGGGAGRPAERRRLGVVEGNYLLHGEGGGAEARPLLDLTLVVGLERGIRLARA